VVNGEISGCVLGDDTFNHSNLWVTDGTATGTSELTRTSGYSGGVFLDNLDPSFAVFGSKALFKAYDSAGHLGFWVTDGTLAGTSQVQVSGAEPSGLLANQNPDFTVFGRIDAAYVEQPAQLPRGADLVHKRQLSPAAICGWADKVGSTSMVLERGNPRMNIGCGRFSRGTARGVMRNRVAVKRPHERSMSYSPARRDKPGR